MSISVCSKGVSMHQITPHSPNPPRHKNRPCGDLKNMEHGHTDVVVSSFQQLGDHIKTCVLYLYNTHIHTTHIYGHKVSVVKTHQRIVFHAALQHETNISLKPTTTTSQQPNKDHQSNESSSSGTTNRHIYLWWEQKFFSKRKDERSSTHRRGSSFRHQTQHTSTAATATATMLAALAASAVITFRIRISWCTSPACTGSRERACDPEDTVINTTTTTTIASSLH